ncbi:metallophosphoesterase family protein [Noviherbaspirillum saxi]|uniref:Metallophosphoesterase n=1 Tax=Noviherbaspirillum saxi TaxID=2320863 RepID=A0A3A3FU10_9BURK|nr:metallophosphoesterase [Noviherbaspirillum saxi]RJF99682.1 metallophosphoesterase [Noviherbaspirillum saxi]
MSIIAHLSDTHFGTEIPFVVEALRKALQRLQPDVVIVSGDVTQRARKHEFQSARQFLDTLSAPAVLVIPGNHDIPLFNVFARTAWPYRNYCEAFGKSHQIWAGSDMVILALDSTTPLRHTRGRLDISQLSALASQIPASDTEPLRIACAHQPLHTAWPEDLHEILIGAGDAAQAFARHRIDIVLSGHVHVPLVTTTHAAFPAVPRHFILCGAGTAVSHRTRPAAPNSFNVITSSGNTDPASVSIAIWRLDAAVAEFIAEPESSFFRSANGWHQQSLE